jgi:hypothetical protein
MGEDKGPGIAMVEEDESERLADYRSNPPYERRVVIFYDVLGWRRHIERAGNDRKNIGDLRRLILQHVRTMNLRTGWGISASTFSDNVVISQPICPETWLLITHLGVTQVASAMKGFLIRGGITIGDIVHDREAVFGPGLNRAYELEHTVARFPRFVIERAVLAELGNLGDLPVEEQGVLFLDPFRLEFIRYISEGKPFATPAEILKEGLPLPKDSKTILDLADADQILSIILEELKPLMRNEPMSDHDFAKLAWLYDRLAKQLGVPLSNSYARPTEPIT